MATTERLTLEQFLAIPEQEPALQSWADGTIHEKMAPTTEHAALQAHSARLLLNGFCRTCLVCGLWDSR